MVGFILFALILMGNRPETLPPPTLVLRPHAFLAPHADPGCPPWNTLAPIFLSKTEDACVPDQATSVRAGYDETGLRLLFECEDAEPWATLTERDAPLYTEEVVEVFLDPVGDREAYFEFEVNVLNAVFDGCMRRVRNGYRKDFRWRCDGLQTAVRLCPGGWCAEWAIPFQSIALQTPRAGDRWLGNFTRIDRPTSRPRELSAWSPTGLAQFHVPARFGVLEFR